VPNELRGQITKLWPAVPALSVAQWQAIDEHYHLLCKWNPKINLVGASTLPVAAEKHYAEGFFLAANCPEGIASVMDCGSGAGFPGFPLAVLAPTAHVTLLEADRRKAAFLREACSLGNVRVRAERLEDVKERFDAVITRAVDPLFVLSWAAGRAKHFGFIGSTEDVLRLATHPAVLDQTNLPLPWKPSSSILWAMFHVEPA
jgi:16S rRNA (guanine(527)-N(7))-methyltransferase RsmG